MKSFIPILALLQSVTCQLAGDLNFQSFSADTGNVKVKYSIALPDGPLGTDFIGQMECTQPGWCGIALGPRMLGSVLIPVWGYQGKVQSSLRWIWRETDDLAAALKADGLDSDVNNYTSPYSFTAYKSNYTTALTEMYPILKDPKYAKFIPPNKLPMAATIKPIAAGTTITDSSLKFTFLCQKCITGDVLTAGFLPDGAFGFAAAPVFPSNPADPDGKLQYHFGASGSKSLDLEKAKSPNFAKVAAQAS